MDQLKRIQTYPTRESYQEDKIFLDKHATAAYKYSTFQDYITAAEHKIGRRLYTHEINYLFSKAQTSKGKQYRWDFMVGHPRGRYVYERPINNIYASTDKTEAELWMEEGRSEEDKNVFNRETPRERGPRLDMRKQNKTRMKKLISDPDLAHEEYLQNKDKYDDQWNANRVKFSLNRKNSNRDFLVSDTVNDYSNPVIGGYKMSKQLNSSVGEVQELVDVVSDSPSVRVAIARLVQEGYTVRAAREIISDAEAVGAVRIANRHVIAEIKAEDVPEKLVPMTRYEGQATGQALEDGKMSHDNEPHKHQTEVGDKFEEGAMSVELETMLASRIASKLDKISASLASIEQRLAKTEESKATLASLEKELDGLSSNVDALDKSLDDMDSKKASSAEKKTEEPALVVAASKDEKVSEEKATDEASDKAKEAASISRESASKADKEVMNIAMGDAATYSSKVKELRKHEEEVARKVQEARAKREARIAKASKQDCADCNKN